jgi:SAM-dependent methyltransferase
MERERRLTVADYYDAELRRHNERFRAATDIHPADRVLDVGCGAGQSTREAARAAVSGSVVGVDVAESMLARARSLTAAEGLHNVTYELGDVQVHPFASDWFDVVISRFGTMFFADPVGAFRNIARASRRGARLVMIVWQGHDRNEWAMAIRRALVGDTAPPVRPVGLDPFSLAEPSTVETILAAAEFADVTFAEVQEPVYYGPDVATAYDIVSSFESTTTMLGTLDAPEADLARERLRALLAAHRTADGVSFDSRAWIVTARRANEASP